jgi:hypothetical protein
MTTPSHPSVTTLSCVDTDCVIDLLREQRRGGGDPAHRKLAQLSATPICHGIFVLCKLEAGAVRYHGSDTQETKHEMTTPCAVARKETTDALPGPVRP